METKQDIRIRKTKVKLKKSLLSLMLKKPISDISVTAICNDAKINRNTFYAHYLDPHKLLDEIENGLYRELVMPLMHADLVNMNFKDFITAILEVIYKNQDICVVLFGPFGDTEFIKHAIDMPKQNVVSGWMKSYGINTFEAELRYSYFSGGSINVIKDWVNSGFLVRIDVIAEVLVKIIGA